MNFKRFRKEFFFTACSSQIVQHFRSSLIRYTLPLLGYLKYATDVRASCQIGSAEQNVGSEDTGFVLAAGATTRL